MKIKRFVAPDMRRAMRLVRDDQGSDAVILSNRRVDGGVEVITAIDYDENLLGRSAPPAAFEPAPGIDRATETWSREPTLMGMKQEVASLRRLLESQMATLKWNETVRDHPVRADVRRKLLAMGLTDTLAGRLAEQTDGTEVETAFNDSLCLLEASLPTLQTEVIDERGAVALVGPTGVGKTTTIAKLAARFVLKYSADELALLTTDSFRIGAQEQLMTFGRILGVPVQLVRDTSELRGAISALDDKRLILVDSTGISQRDHRLNRELESLHEADLRVLLTLSAHAQQRVLEEAIQAFGQLGPCGCVLTKIDEAASIGGAIAALVEHALPLAYVTDGQNVPEDLHWARSKRLSLIDRAVALGRDTIDDCPAPLTPGMGVVNAHA